MTTASKAARGSRRSTTDPATETETIEGADLPGFRPPATTPGPDPLDPTATTVRTTPASPDEIAGDAAELLDAATSSTEHPGASSRASTDVGPVELPGLDEIARMLVGLGSQLVRRLRARRGQLPEGAWMADENDRAAIGDPLARIAERHLPEGGNAPADVVDAIAAGVGTVIYVEKGLAVEAGPLGNVEPVDLDQVGPTQ